MPTIETSIEERAGWLWLNRPERLNAINADMLTALKAALTAFEADEEVRVIVIAGRGRSFCAGFDVKRDERQANYGGGREAIADYVDLSQRMQSFLTLWDCPKPIICGVHGHCLAAGTVLAVMSDITVVTDDAQIGLPSMPLGGGYLSPTWVHLVGPKRAKLMSFDAGRRIDGATAVEWGWANHSVAPDALIGELTHLAQRIARTPSGVLRMKKVAINRAVELGGMRLAAMWGAETDALVHQSHELAPIEELIDELGVSSAAKHFNEFGADRQHEQLSE